MVSASPLRPGQHTRVQFLGLPPPGGSGPRGSDRGTRSHCRADFTRGMLDAACPVQLIYVGDHLVKAPDEQFPSRTSIGAHHPKRDALSSDSLTHRYPPMPTPVSSGSVSNCARNWQGEIGANMRAKFSGSRLFRSSDDSSSFRIEVSRLRPIAWFVHVAGGTPPACRQPGTLRRALRLQPASLSRCCASLGSTPLPNWGCEICRFAQSG